LGEKIFEKAGLTEHRSGGSIESAGNIRNWGIHLEARGLECGGEIKLIRRGAMVF